MPKPKHLFPAGPTAELESSLKLPPEPDEPRVVVGGIQRDFTIIRLGEHHHLDEIAGLFLHHVAGLDGFLPGNPLRRLIGYVVASDMIAERICRRDSSVRRGRARLICIGGHDHPTEVWARPADEPDTWTPLDEHDEHGDLDKLVGAMVAELGWYQMYANHPC